MSTDAPTAPTPDSIASAADAQADAMTKLQEHAADLQKQLDDKTAAFDASQAQNETLSSELSDTKDQLDKARAVQPPRATVAASKARAIGPMKDKEVQTSDVLLDMIRAATSVEIAISDGAKEIKGLPAITLFDDKAWRVSPVGLTLIGEIAPKVTAGPLERSVSIAGYGLLIDGKQVAYRPRFERLDLNAHQTVDLTNDIVI